MNTLLQIWPYLTSHPLLLGAIIYVLLNLAKRIPPPANQPWLTLWQVFEATMLLSWDRYGGALKTWETVETATTPAPRALTADELADEVLRRLDTAKTDPVITVTSADPTITIDRDTDPATKE